MSDENNNLIEKILLDVTKENKTQRRWGVFFKLLTFSYLFFILFIFYNNLNSSNNSFGSFSNENKHVAVIDLNGQISYGGDWSSSNIIQGLSKAFENEMVEAIIININSPGGSPVQSDEVFQYIMEMKTTTGKPVISVINDLGASGAYYIASASDDIYSNRMSLVGSIGVISGSFGFSELMSKIGIERRVYTSGTNKAMLDPFSPENESQILKWKEVLKNTHEQFIASVKMGRGERLKENDEIFSGRVWSGEQALNLGLIDGFESIQSLKNGKFKTLEFVNYTKTKTINVYDILKSSGEGFSLGVLNTLNSNIVQ